MKTFQKWALALAGIASILIAGCQSTALTSAKVYIQQNDWASARDQLQLAVAENPADTEAQMLLGVAEATAGDYAAAASAFDVAEADSGRVEEASRWRRKFWVEVFNLGLGALNAGDLEEAATQFSKATVLSPAEPMAFRNLGIVYERMERMDEAIVSYEKAVALDPSDDSTALQLGYVHYLEERWAQAIEWIGPRVAAAGDAGYYRVLASAHDHLDQQDEALMALQGALTVEPEDAELLSDVAGIYLRRDAYDEALPYLEKAFQLAPEDNLIGYNYAIALVRLEDEPTAITVLETVVSHDDQFADAYDLLSQLYLRADRVKDGQAAYDRAEKLRAQ